ncbi:glycosyltransferase family 8 protein [Chelatococcus reniformis]|uniref:Glycosyl transferase n=1 Tax=Chelatococcus reniformis TaxID=1494448 RepID=A0A916UCA4_9HYPH|nr:glycosyltransferase [Chelatococcus reniformis]GGC68219.1 hypothetical protein GCM10010994_28490 [Chelatococcus reniformis]
MKAAVAFLTDKDGYRLVRYAITSLLMKTSARLDVYLFCRDFRPNGCDPIFRFAESARNPVALAEINSSEFANFKNYNRITNTAMLKLDLTYRLLEKYDRVLYADNDVLFFTDVSPLLRIRMDGHALAAVPDVAEQLGFTGGGIVERSRERGRTGAYFNAGLLLFDCQKLASHDYRIPYLETALRHETEGDCDYKQQCGTPDQCSLNVIFDNDWKQIDLRWNAQSCLKHTSVWRDAYIRHYNGWHKAVPLRPWRNDKKDTALINAMSAAWGERHALRWPATSAIYELDRHLRGRNEHVRFLEQAIKQMQPLI